MNGLSADEMHAIQSSAQRNADKAPPLDARTAKKIGRILNGQALAAEQGQPAA